ncbi:MAG: bifunctional oligoribonuclease/PAP phosphatase NrnA [Paludibacteraceae bacterium]|nr:bifunctional oligoribonuclease/PAP phosphatase NrnA [Paludibacteraceae bacterium]
MISKIIAEELIEKVYKAINEVDKIAILVHVDPDGDAIGAALGLWHYLMTIEKEPVVISPTSFPNFLSWMPGSKQILIYENDKTSVEKALASAELIFGVDFNDRRRLEKMSEFVSKILVPTILIDHHLQPEKFAKITISYPEISSTSELIFRLICRMGDFSKINLACAECIYTGMMTDTGNFTYNSNDPEIYIIISELIKIGIDKDEIYRKVFNTYSENRLKLLGYCLYKKMKIFSTYRTAIISLSQQELIAFNYTNGDAEGFVNIPLSIEGIDFSVLLREEKDKIKISLRSQGNFPANKVAADLFGGGGHLNAAGAESYTSLEETEKQLLNALPDYLIFFD